MCECLWEVAEMLSAWTNLFGIESKMVRVPQEFLKQQLSLFQLPGPRQTLDVPERACSEAALAAGNPVHMRAFRLIAADQGIFHQSRFYRFHCRAPHRIDRADEPHKRHQESRSIQILGPLRLHERLKFVI